MLGKTLRSGRLAYNTGGFLRLRLKSAHSAPDLSDLSAGPERNTPATTIRGATRRGSAQPDITQDRVDHHPAAARRLGAVNTVVLRDGRTIGHSTDWFGLAGAFRRSMGDVARGAVRHLYTDRGRRRLFVLCGDGDRPRAEMGTDLSGAGVGGAYDCRRGCSCCRRQGVGRSLTTATRV